MRTAIAQQLSLMLPPIAHPRGLELEAMSQRLWRIERSVYERVLQDLGGPTAIGREGMSAEQVVRVSVLRELMQWSFEELAFHLQDSACCRAFCSIGLGQKPPSAGTLKRNVKALSAASLQEVHRAVIKQAVDDGVEDGARVRGDSTVTETNIHKPTDSTLLWDVVRKLTGLMVQGQKLVGKLAFVDHRRRAKRRICEIRDAKGLDAKRPLYRDLCADAEATTEAAERAAIVLRQKSTRSKVGQRRAKLAKKLESVISLAHRVLSQTRRRVFEGQNVGASDKIVSLSEPHTDVIVKGPRYPEYGHKVFLASGRSGLILDCHIGDGNPADSGQAVPTIERVADAVGRIADEVSFDGGYASKANIASLKELGVSEVAFHKKCGIHVEEMTSSQSVYERLRRFRAAIEATIGWLKRAFGLRRCYVSGRASFDAHVKSAVIAANLLLLARHDIA